MGFAVSPLTTSMMLACPAATALSSVGDNNITLSTTLNEASIAYYVVIEHPSSMPAPAQVCTGSLM
jgi:hypothetical protein